MKDVRECLLQYTELEDLLDMQLEQIRELRENMTQLTAQYGTERTTGGKHDHDRIGRGLGLIEEVEEDIIKQTRELLQQKETVRNLIASIRNPRHRTLMRMRYLYSMPWEQIADMLNITPRSAYRIHAKAIEYLNARMKEEWRQAMKS